MSKYKDGTKVVLINNQEVPAPVGSVAVIKSTLNNACLIKLIGGNNIHLVKHHHLKPYDKQIPLAKDTMKSSVGDSEYHTKATQPWDLWLNITLTPWQADCVKRLLRRSESRDDLNKVKHIKLFMREYQRMIRGRYGEPCRYYHEPLLDGLPASREELESVIFNPFGVSRT